MLYPVLSHLPKLALPLCCGLLICLLLAQCQPKPTTNNQKQTTDYQDFAKAFSRKEAPKPREWLHSQHEPGQSFAAYQHQLRHKPQQGKNRIYLLPLGTFDWQERKWIAATVQYLQAFFGLEVVLLPLMPTDTLPESAWLIRKQGRQLLTGFVHRLLKQRMPADAYCIAALTNHDLVPGKAWGFVFGQASIANRSAAISIYLLKIGGKTNPEARQQSLARILKTSSHEIGHLFQFAHCKKWDCVMNGSMNIQEMDDHPLYLDPECLLKLQYATNNHLDIRYQRLMKFMKKYRLSKSYPFIASRLIEVQNLPDSLAQDFEYLSKIWLDH